MDADKKARLVRIAGFVCLGVALFNMTFAVLAAIEAKNIRKLAPGVATSSGVFVVGIICLTRDRRRSPPDA